MTKRCTRLTDFELEHAERAMARTIVPIDDYDGSYEQPVVLVQRRLGFDAVELVSGPWPYCHQATMIANHNDEVRGLLDVAVAAWKTYFATVSSDDKEALRLAYVRLHGYIEGDETLSAALLTHEQSLSRRKVTMQSFYVETIVSAAVTMRDLGLF